MSRSAESLKTLTGRNGAGSWAGVAADLRRRAFIAAITVTTGAGTFLGSGSVTVAAALAEGAPAAAVLIDGNAVVTGFSGAQGAKEAGGQAPGNGADSLTIDLDGPSARVIDLQAPGAPPQAQLLPAPKPFTATARQIGQVFAVTLDSASPPNIYVAATSAYGLPIVVPGPNGIPVRARRGAPDARFMDGLFGPAGEGGGPGSIWRIDGTTGAVRLFTNVTLDGTPNSGPSLGGLAFDKVSGSIFVADRQTGMIERFGLDGAERGRFDHGTQGRTAAGLLAVPYDRAARLDIAKPAFATDNPATFGYAPVARLVFGLAVHDGRLYYAVADGLQVWSVGLKRDGSFAADARIEVQVPPWDGESEISKIAFDDQGRMLLAERPAPTGAYDFEALAKAAVGRVLRYRPVAPQFTSTAAPQPATYAPALWQPEPDEYAVGFGVQLRNGNGGLAIGYNYTPDGRIDRRSCGDFLWSSGEELRVTSDPALARRLDASGPANVDGLQGNALSLVRPANVPPLKTYFVDYDDRFDDAAARGHLGDVAIWRTCGGESAAIDAPAGEDEIGGLIGEPGWPVCHDDQPRHEGARTDDLQQIEFRRHRHCCPREYFHQGRCWRFPPPCPRDEIKLPNGRCCTPTEVRDGQCGNLPCPRGEVKRPDGSCCPPTEVRDGQCGNPPPPCPRGDVKLPNGTCCPPTDVRDGQCGNPPPPRTCLRDGRTGNGHCGPVRKIDLPPRRHIVIDPPHRQPDRPIVKRVFSVKPRTVIPTPTLRTFAPVSLARGPLGGGRMTFGMGGGMGHMGGFGRR